MSKHDEISTTYFPEAIVDNALFALEISEGLHYRKTGKPVSVAERERCIVAISMLFISFEGAFNRIIYFLINDEHTSDKYMALKDVGPPQERLKGLLDNTVISRKLVERFKEGLVLRNAIAHGHLYRTGRDIHRKLSSTSKIVLDDNNRNYSNYVNPRTFRTRNLKLHVVPSEVGISDLYQILKLWNAIYRRLNSIHGSIAWLQGYIFPDYTAHLKLNDQEDKLRELENKLIGHDDGSLTELLFLFDSKYRR